MPGCQPRGDGPPRLACPVAHLGAAREAIFLFDDSQRVLSIMLSYPPQTSAEAAEQAVQPLLRAIAHLRGAPQVKKTEAQWEWLFSRGHFIALVRLARRGAGWQVQTLLSDPTFTPHIVHRPRPAAR